MRAKPFPEQITPTTFCRDFFFIIIIFRYWQIFTVVFFCSFFFLILIHLNVYSAEAFCLYLIVSVRQPEILFLKSHFYKNKYCRITNTMSENHSSCCWYSYFSFFFFVKYSDDLFIFRMNILSFFKNTSNRVVKSKKNQNKMEFSLRFYLIFFLF